MIFIKRTKPCLVLVPNHSRMLTRRLNEEDIQSRWDVVRFNIRIFSHSFQRNFIGWNIRNWLLQMLMLHVHDTQNKTEDPSLASYAQGYAQDQLENQMKEVVKRRGSPFLFGLRNIPSKIHRTSMSHHAQNNHKCIHRPLIFYILSFSHFDIFTLWRWLRLFWSICCKGQERHVGLSHSTNPILVFNSLSCQAGTLTSD